MDYDIEYDHEEVLLGDIFQSVDRTLGMMIGSDARDPLDYDEYLIPRTTPMAPVRFTSGEDNANTHDHGIWMPIRREIVTSVEDGTTFIVPNANPFHVNDHIISIDILGPVTGGGVNLALITNINYATGLITVAATAGMGAGDWVEVYENCSTTIAAGVPTSWQIPMVSGMLLGPHDSRIKPSATSGQVMPSTVVTHGSIREADVNWVGNNTYIHVSDVILIPQADSWNTASGGIQIITLEHGDEAVELPDFWA